VDRPLFEDYWERLLASLDALRCKAVRTVYRLTLVKERNVAEIHQYAQLVARGEPHFIEVKGVTFCGDSKGTSYATLLRLSFKALVRLW
jgi:tRNA wybutosine-synthesizing protein 1